MSNGIIFRPDVGDLLREYLAVLVVRLDETGEILYASAPAEMMFGVQMRGAMVGKPVEFYIPDRLGDAHKRHRAAFSKNPRTRMMGEGLHLEGKKTDGSLFPVEISLIPAVLSNVETVTAVIYDMTGRVRARKDSDPDFVIPNSGSKPKK